MIKLADYIFQYLEEFGIKNVFLVSGGSAMHLNNALGKYKKIKYTACHHEQSCAMAAEAYAKFTNNIGVALVTSGPGATNAVTGVAGAFIDSVPCLIISGQSKKEQTTYNANITGLRQLGVQEINIIPIVKSITKYAVMINEPEKIKYHLEKALYLAKSGRPGPVWLDVPLDIQGQIINEDLLEGFQPDEIVSDYKKEPEISELKNLTHLFKKSKRPVVIAGHGIKLAGAIEKLDEFVKKYNLPVVTPFLGIDTINSDSENYIGRIGTKGTRAGNFALQNADLVLSIGSRLCVSSTGHEFNLFSREAKIIVVDIDPTEHTKETIKIDKFINADALLFINGVFALMSQSNVIINSKWLDQCNKWKAKYPVCLKEYKEEKKGVNYYYLVDEVSKKTDANMPIISDAGSSFYVTAQAVNIKKEQHLITSGGLATMGFNLPAAIGISVANENNSVVVFTGEGSLQMNIQELQTIIHSNLPVKIFVVNNNGYYSIRKTQERFFDSNFVGEGIESGLSFPNLKEVSKAYGIEYFKVCNNQELNNIIDKILISKDPVICEVINVDNQLIIPTVSSEVKKNGSIVSKPLEDMFPFLSRDEFLNEMIVKEVGE